MLKLAEKHRVKRTQLPLIGLMLGVKFTEEDFVHEQKLNHPPLLSVALISWLTAPQLRQPGTDPASRHHLIFLSVQRVADQ